MNGLISVVIPVYNVEKYLRECLDSVLNQSYQNFEIILVNDGSTDKSVEICEEYCKKDCRVRLIHQMNAGASAARNTGMKKATGEYLYFLDSDDWLEGSAFEKLINHMNKSHADMVFFDAYAVDETKGIKSEKYYSHKHEYKSGKGYEVMNKLLQHKEFHVTPWHMFFRKAFIDDKKLCFEEGIIYEDMIFAYQVFCEAKTVSYVPEYLYFRRFREDSVMTSKVRIKNFDSASRVYYAVKNYSEQLSEEVKNKNYVVRCAYNGIHVYGRLSKEDKKEVHNKYTQLKKDILANNAFGDKALQLYCYNKIFWMMYKALLKISVIIRRKEK